MKQASEPTKASIDKKALFETIEARVLELTYQNNLACFKEQMPDLYAFLIQYTPKQKMLGVDDYGQYNLFNGKNWVYPKDLDDAIDQQIQVFCDQPLRFVVSKADASAFQAHYFFHTFYLEKITRIFDEIPVELIQKESFFAPLFLVMGVGLGKHLPKLVEKFDIFALHIYEPNLDVFHASLFLTDYATILRSFTERKRPFKIQVGQSREHFINGVSGQVKHEGFFYGVQVYLYCHYNSEDVQLAREGLHQYIHRVYKGVGFFEDEMIGLNHTVLNCEKGLPILKKGAKSDCFDTQAPVFIVGNGPSLDYSLETIKRYQDKAIIISCSSSLPALLKAGIQPDIHVEVERTEHVSIVLESACDMERLKEISLFCLNPVHPDVTGMFKEAFLACKTNDAGTVFLNKMVPNTFQIVESCNPTSGNGAAAIAAHLGFQKLYLFGIDFGMVEDGKHHSEQSLYFDGSLKEYNKSTFQTNMETEGNFREKVKTNYSWDMASYTLECLVLEHDIAVFNTSDGAKIKATQPLRIEDIPVFEKTINKAELMNHIRSKQLVVFSESSIKKIDPTLKKEYRLFEDWVNEILASLNEVPHTKAGVLEKQRNHREILKRYIKESRLLNHFAVGSLSNLELVSSGVLFMTKDDAQIQDYVRKSYKIQAAYFLSCLEWIRIYYKKTSTSFQVEDFVEKTKHLPGIKDVIG